MTRGVQPIGFSGQPAVSPILKRVASGPVEGEPEAKRVRLEEASDSPSPPLGLSRQITPPRWLKLSQSSGSLEPQQLLEDEVDALAHAILAEEVEEAEEAAELVEQPFDMRFYSKTAQGLRPANEDAEFDCKIPGVGSAAVILDGHGGVKLANKAARFLKKELPKLIPRNPEKSDEIIINLFDHFQKHVTVPMQGATALAIVFDTVRRKGTIAGLGDTRAMLFKKMEEEITYEWLIEEMNWSTPDEEAKVREVLGDDLFETWKAWPTKQRRFPHFPVVTDPKNPGKIHTQGVNVSHALGDKDWTFKGKSAISHIPKTKIIDLESDMLVLLACDGLWDFVTPENLIRDVIKPHWEHRHMPEKIVEYALKTSTDNVSVICAWSKVVGAPSFHNTQLTPATPSYQSLEEKEEKH